MISTVTTTTVTIVSSVRFAGTIGFIAVLGLIGFLLVKELASGDRRPATASLSNLVNLAIVPLLLVFAAIMVDKVWTVL